MEKKYRCIIDKFFERGVVVNRGEILPYAIDQDRAKALLNAYFIEEVKDEKDLPKVEEVKEAKEIDNKMEIGSETKAEGKGSSLLGKKKKK